MHLYELRLLRLYILIENHNIKLFKYPNFEIIKKNIEKYLLCISYILLLSLQV